MKASEYNQFSEELVRKLQPNDRVSYRVLNVRPDPDNYDKLIFPAALQIPSTDEIYDKFKKEFVKIAAIERTDNDGNPIFLNIVFTANNFGFLFLNGNNPVHQKIYQYIELCNFNQSNKSANEEVEKYFQRIDTKKDAERERELRREIVAAVNLALELDDAKAKDTAMALGIDAESIEEIRNLLEDYAEENPVEFMAIAKRASLEFEGVIKAAIRKGIISQDISSQTFNWVSTGKEIYKYKKSPNKNYIKELADYLQENNPEELKAIETRLG
jgi:hypothetical protein